MVEPIKVGLTFTAPEIWLKVQGSLRKTLIEGLSFGQKTV